MLKVFRLIDLHYDKVCEEYRKNHSKLESKDFWSSYLELKEVQNKEIVNNGVKIAKYSISR